MNLDLDWLEIEEHEGYLVLRSLEIEVLYTNANSYCIILN